MVVEFNSTFGSVCHHRPELRKLLALFPHPIKDEASLTPTKPKGRGWFGRGSRKSDDDEKSHEGGESIEF